MPDMPEPTPGDLLTFAEAMRALRVSRSTLYRLMHAGQLRAHKVGATWRFRPADVAACVVAVEASATPAVFTSPAGPVCITSRNGAA